MNCAKCGKEIQDGILCVDCLMEEADRINSVAAEAAPVVEAAEETVVEAAPVVEAAAEEAIAEAAPVVEAAEETVVEAAPVVEAAEETVVEAAPVTVAAPVETIVPSVEEAAPKKKKWPKVLAIVMSAVLVLGIGAGAVYWYFLSRQDNKSPVVDTMDRFCTSMEELDFYGILNSMISDDLMDTLSTYLEEADMTFEDIQEMINELVAEYGELDDIDVSYRIIGEPTEVTGDEFDDLAQKMKKMFINDVERIIKADIELYMKNGEENNTSVENVYFYCVEEKWYMLPGVMFESDIYDSLF